MNNVSYKLDPSNISIKISEKESEVKNLSYDLVNEFINTKTQINYITKFAISNKRNRYAVKYLLRKYDMFAPRTWEVTKRKLFTIH